jgi:hypothetical protein
LQAATATLREATRRRRGLTTTIGIFLLVRIVFWISGGRFRWWGVVFSWQVLDVKELSRQPIQSVAALHIQPPAFNLFIALVVDISPFSNGITFQVLYFFFALVTVIGVWLLLDELGFSPVINTIGACIVAASPVLLSYENLPTYEVPVAMLLVLSAWLCVRYVKERTFRLFLAFVITTTLVVLTRALFHPLWLIVVLGALLWFARPAFEWRRCAAALAIPLVLVGGWMLKNEIRFGDPSMTSWLGMNLTRGVVAPMPKHDVEAMIRQGTLSKAAAVPPFSVYKSYEPYFGKCHSSSHNPLLALPEKDHTGLSNFNAQCFIPVYNDAMSNALAALRHRPQRYLSTRWAPTVAHFEDDYGPLQIGTNGIGTHGIWALDALQYVYKPMLVSPKMHIDESGWMFPLFPGYGFPFSFMLLFSTIFLTTRGAIGAWRAVRKRANAADAGWAFVGFTVLYLTIVSITTEFGENARFRTMADPLLLGLGAAALAAQVQLAVRALRSRRVSAST